MEQVARIAGMAGMADAADPTAEDAAKDVELGQEFTHHQNTSRASLPHFRQRSQSVVTGDFPHAHSRNASGVTDVQTAGEPDGYEQDPGEIPWGPEHPCYPHLNPHVAMASPLYESTRIIRVRRDWMVAGDLAPAFKNIYPEILEPYLGEDAYRALIKHVNTALVAAFDPRDAHNWLDATLGLLTGWLWDDLGFTAIKRRLAALEAWLVDWNRAVGARAGVRAIPLRRTGYTSLDLQIPNPPLGADMPPTPSLAPSSRPGSVRTMGSSWTNTTASRSQLGFATEPQPQPEVPPIPAEYLQAAARVQRQQERDGVAA